MTAAVHPSARAAAIDRYLSAALRVAALWQPWASLCVAPDPAHGGAPAKVHETRSWFPRGELPLFIAIHATKKLDGENKLAFSEPRFRDALKRCGFFPGDPRPFLERKLTPPAGLRPVPLGAIVGVATVVSFRATETVAGGMAHRFTGEHEDDQAFGNYGPKRYAWRLADALMLPKPVAHSGRQEALYPLDVTTLDAVHAQLRAMRGAA